MNNSQMIYQRHGVGHGSGKAVLHGGSPGRFAADWRAKNPKTAPATTLHESILEQFPIPANSKAAIDEQLADDLPETWCWARFGEVTNNHDGKRVPIKSE